MLLRLYYLIKPIIPRCCQLFFRRKIAQKKLKKYKDVWPISPTSAKRPDYFSGWPKGEFAFVLTHDVDTKRGHDRCTKLIELELELGFRSSFNFVPERYEVSPSLRQVLRENGFEIGVHGLVHDGRLFESKDIFQKRAKKINRYLKDWDAVGFYSPAMHRNLEWIQDLDILYDNSTFDTDPFEPQNDGVDTIFPFWVGDSLSRSGYVEIPYTLPQDHCLFIILGCKDISIWKEKLDWIVANGGMAFLITHPDYMFWEEKEKTIEDYPVKLYRDFLLYVKEKYSNVMWHVLPKDLALFWKSIVK